MVSRWATARPAHARRLSSSGWAFRPLRNGQAERGLRHGQAERELSLGQVERELSLGQVERELSLGPSSSCQSGPAAPRYRRLPLREVR